VNASACWRPKAASPLLPELHYSYATCGYLNDYTEAGHSAFLQRRSIRVSYPNDASSGFTLVTHDGKKQGSFPTFMQGIFDQFHMTVEVVPVSQKSKGRSPSSSFTACVHEVALNGTDLCIGNFWSTSQRLLMAPFTTEVYQDTFYLVAFTTEEAGILGTLASPFRPFQPSLWLGIVGMTVLASLVIYFLERGKSNFREGVMLYGASRSVYVGSRSLLQSGLAWDAETLGGRIMHLTFGFFAMIVIASYTANLASSLVSKVTSSEIDSIDGGISAGMKFCGMSAIQASLLASKPGLRSLYVPVADAAEALTNMDEGICQLAILAKIDFENAQRDGGTDARCNKVLVGEVILSIGNAMPIRPDLQEPMSWAMALRSSSGAYELAAVQARRAYVEPKSCGAQGQRDDGRSLADMASIFVVALTGMVFGVLANCFRYGSSMAMMRASSLDRAQLAEPARSEERPTLEVTVRGAPQTGPTPRIVVRYVDMDSCAEFVSTESYAMPSSNSSITPKEQV